MDFILGKTLLYFLIGGFLVFLAVTVIRDNFSNRLNRVAGSMFFFAGLGPLSLAIGLLLGRETLRAIPLTDSSLYNLIYLWEFFFPTLLLFSWLFPADRLRELRFPRLPLLIFLPQAMHLVLTIFFYDVGGMISFLNSGFVQEGLLSIVLKPLAYLATRMLILFNFSNAYGEIIFGIINLIYVAVALYYFETGKRYLRNPRLISQTHIVLWGIRISLALYALSFFINALSTSETASVVARLCVIVALVAGSGTLAFAIVRHQFLNVQLVFRQSLIYTFTSAILVGIYLLIGMRCQEMLAPILGARAEVVSWVIIVFLLMLFQPINSWIDNVIRSMFMRTRSDHRNIIERFSRQIISQFEPKALRQTIEETLKTSLLVEQVYFVIYDDSIGEYAILPSEDYDKRTVVDREDLMLRGINLLDTPSYYGSLSNYEKESDLAEFLISHNVKLILPMKDAKNLLGFLALSSKAAGYRYTPEDLNLLGVLSNQMVGALTNARLYVESLERLRLQEEVSMARQIQLELLPAKAPHLPCGTITAHSIPSRTIGGDFYDFIHIEKTNRLGIVIADASGKGMPAALLIAQVQAILRSEVNNGNSIATILANMNRQISLSTSSEKYVTLVYGELDQISGLFHFANAGHNYPILVRKNGDVELLITGGPVIGAFSHLQFTEETIKLAEEDVLFFFTDGLSEAMDINGQEYGEERIKAQLVSLRGKDPETIMAAILEDVRRFDVTFPPQDDTTIVAFKMNSACVETRSSNGGQR
ncbi:MAG: SpoIIE family protein phosphatase [candidate division Zixibacteria bacterium]|nr:SpoIIE family protein phosphatase [candidate division Zixibacteria bacterium]